jgi:ABC-type multidrug transport system ATPase subunit
VSSHSPTNLIVDTNGLTKRYGERVAVNKLDLRVRRGEVYGFLGPNGAGKTTTLRMLLGLAKITSGSATVAGAAPGTPEGLARIGAMIEAPAFYPFLSGRDNLKVMAKHAGVPEARIDPVLEEVDLASRGGDKFATYSQGMKQRLGVAAALFKDPDLLILDEPTNGLDPAGVAEMRILIRTLGQGRRTVLISSHLLVEIEQICDRVGVIRNGKMVAEGTVDELRGQDMLRIQADPLSNARSLLIELLYVSGIELNGDAMRVATDPARTAEINCVLVSAGIAVSELHWERAALEEIFLELTQDPHTEGSK